MSSHTLTVELHLNADTAEELERFGLDLKDDLGALPAVTIAPEHRGPVPTGSKAVAGVVDWNQVLLTLAASGGVLTTLIGVIQSRVSRARTAELVIGGDKLVVSGLATEDQRRLIEAWVDRHQKTQRKRG